MQVFRNFLMLPTNDKYLLSKINTNIINYPDLKYFKNIDDILKNNSAIIFYHGNDPQIGHWTCIKKTDNTISYFDSYGRNVDPKVYLNGEFPYLSNLLLKCPYNLNYNENNYQNSKYATCGHHCIVRILFDDLEKYQNFMNKFDNEDALVAGISLML